MGKKPKFASTLPSGFAVSINLNTKVLRMSLALVAKCNLKWNHAEWSALGVCILVQGTDTLGWKLSISF